MAKGFQRLGLKLQLMGFGVASFLLPWVGVQHLETNRAALSQEKKAVMDKELQLQQEVESLNKQVKTTQQQLSQKTAKGQAFQTTRAHTSVAKRKTSAVPPPTSPTRKAHSRTKAS